MKGILRHGKKWHILLIAALVVCVGSFFIKDALKKDTNNAVCKNEEPYPYRTVNDIDSSGALYPYEFHKIDGNAYYKECAAIIKKIDPSADNYKSYCRSVIADIIKSMGTDNIEICIYDDDRAYELSEVELDGNFKGMDKSEMDALDAHLVAIYHGDIGQNDDNHTLYFYREANNRYTENEAFEPTNE